MPNHAASVFKQFNEFAAEHGKNIGSFSQRGTTFQRADAVLRVCPEGIIAYDIQTDVGVGKERIVGSFKLTHRIHARHLVRLLTKQCRDAQREP